MTGAGAAMQGRLMRDYPPDPALVPFFFPNAPRILGLVGRANPGKVALVVLTAGDT
jgi:hypothetical protein